jgi:hypothetical protein
MKFGGLFCLIMAMLSLIGCGGGNGDDPPATDFGFQIVEWTFPNSVPEQRVVEGDPPVVNAGVQFELKVIDRNTGNVDPAAIKQVRDITFFRDGNSFQPIDVGLTPDLNPFYRIDFRDKPFDYEVRGTLVQNNASYPINQRFTIDP